MAERPSFKTFAAAAGTLAQAYSWHFAGGGVARGRSSAKTDKHAGSVVERPVSPKDILATLYHLMGVDPHIQLIDRTGRQCRW